MSRPEAEAALKARRFARGECVKCGKPNPTEWRRCAPCRKAAAAVNAARYKRLKEEGRCVFCGKTKRRKSVDCDACRGNYMEYRNGHAYRAKQRRLMKARRAEVAEEVTTRKKRWTPEEDAVLLRKDLTIDEMAIKLGRGYSATAHRRTLIGAPRRTSKAGRIQRAGAPAPEEQTR